jgi:Ca-activated chloride channel homolog
MSIMSAEWCNPSYAWLFIGVALVCFVLCIQFVFRQKAIAKLAGARLYLFDALPSLYVRCFKVGLLVMALVCFVLALMRPQFSKQTTTITQQARDVFIALDISRSMLARDMAGIDRLTHAKEKIKKLIHELACERVGLILFSSTAFVQCPLTTDHKAFLLFLDAVDVETISGGSTALDHVLSKALTAFEMAPNRKSKLLVLFTDGEDFSTNLSAVRREAREKKLSLFACGIGSVQGAPIPVYDDNGKLTGHQKDKNNAIVITRLNEDMLKQLTEELDGFYCTSTVTAHDIKSLAQAVGRFEKEQLVEKKRDLYNDSYHYLTLMGLILCAIEWLL